ncbi:FAD-dependent oxidoreductase [Mycobacterium sp. NPDC003323]
MRILIIGAGPTGLFSAIALARRGHQIRIVDRDAGPPASGHWQRRGVMQLHHAHTFRAPVVDALDAEMPQVLDDLAARGAGIAHAGDGRVAALLCRRATFDAVLRQRAARTRGIVLHTGNVGVLTGRDGTVCAGGTPIDADLVLDASGRSGRIAEDPRGAGVLHDCGAVYVTRQYRLRAGAHPPVNGPIGLALHLDGYVGIAFLHEDRTFSVTIIHDGSDRRLRRLRDEHIFECAVASIPQLRDWTAAATSAPISPVLAGGRLYNSYRGQPALPGVIAVGDVVCSTTPLAGRGVALALRQACELVDLIGTAARSRPEIVDIATQFGSWCDTFIKPWFDDQVYADTHRLRRWAGAGIDFDAVLPADLITAAAGQHPELARLVAPYERMDALPQSLAAAEPLARSVYASGWRAPFAPGPTRAELGSLCAASAA